MAAVIRGAFVDAANYLRRIEAEERKPEDERKPVDRDLKLEALGKVLRREIPWRQHCHRADDIATAMRIAQEFGYDLVIDHGTEAHLLADLIAARGIPVIIGPLFTSRSKVELRNRSLANPGKLAAAGVTIAITTDHPVVPINFLVHQASLVGQVRARPGDRAARADHQPGAHHRRRRPARLDRGRQGRRLGCLVGRPARRAAAGSSAPRWTEPRSTPPPPASPCSHPTGASRNSGRDVGVRQREVARAAGAYSRWNASGSA